MHSSVGRRVGNQVPFLVLNNLETPTINLQVTPPLTIYLPTGTGLSHLSLY